MKTPRQLAIDTRPAVIGSARVFRPDGWNTLLLFVRYGADGSIGTVRL
jgi:hypothetical protein